MKIDKFEKKGCHFFLHQRDQSLVQKLKTSKIQLFLVQSQQDDDTVH